MIPLIKNRKRLLFVAGDLIAVFLANTLAVALRFDFDWSAFVERYNRTAELIVIDLLLTPCVFYLSGVYQGYWKYAGLDDLFRLARAVVYRTVSLVVIFYAVGFVGLSRAVVIMSTILLLILAGLLRLSPRFQFEFVTARRRSAGPRTLIVGAGDTGESLLRELKKSSHASFTPIGFVDDDPEKAGLKIHGVPVLGDTRALESIVDALGVREVIIAIPGASDTAKRQIFDVCRKTGAHFKTVPTRGEVQRGAARIGQIRPVELEDLLGRDVVSLDQQALRQSLSGRRILVTGAAGSIGRELAHQIAGYGPQELTLLDRNENNLFYLETQLRDAYPHLGLRVVVGDVLDRVRIVGLFRDARPQIVFHAAAYKHVPLMELNPIEAIKNNVLATQYLAEAADASGVERFIYISTDKAVRPTSVMGATKRLGERLIKSLGSKSARFMAVRFGNVMGSDGSVIPTFRRQIAGGGPVTVTHPEATRYFMTIPEAVQLVTMAGAMGEGGETFLLQMGRPVRIVDLAKNMIELSGLKPDTDIRVVFTGLRPGEKLHEELKSDHEEALPTSNEKIMVLTGVEPLNAEGLERLGDLEEAVWGGSARDAIAWLGLLVPDYSPSIDLARAQPLASAQKVVGFGVKRRLDTQA